MMHQVSVTMDVGVQIFLPGSFYSVSNKMHSKCNYGYPIFIVKVTSGVSDLTRPEFLSKFNGLEHGFATIWWQLPHVLNGINLVQGCLNEFAP